VAQLLRTAGADLNARDEEDDTQLHNAACQGHAEIAKVLLTRTNLNARNKYQETPLHYAACEGHVDVAQVLLAARADFSTKNANGKTPLDLAKQEGHLAVVLLLQQESEPLTKSAGLRVGGAGDPSQ